MDNRGVRSVTVDTSRSRCAEWTPGRGLLLTVLPLWIERSVSPPGDRNPVADAGTMGRSAQVVAGALVAARFLPIWLAMAALIVVAAFFAPNTLESTSWSYILPYRTILAIAALGQMLVVMQAGIDLSTAGVISLCGNVLVGVSVGSGRGLTVGILVCVGLGALVGLVNGILVGIVKLNPLIVTLAVGQIVLAYSSKYARDHTVSLQVPDSLSSWAAEKPSGSAQSSGRARRSPSWSRSHFATRLPAGASRRWAQIRELRGWPDCVCVHTSCSPIRPRALRA